jgi:hypothetical protein
VLVFGIAPPAMATVDSNFIVKDGIEYYMQTNKSIYDLGENVEMLYRVTNLSDQSVTYYFGQYPVWNFWVEKDKEQIWIAFDAWSSVFTSFTVAPGESHWFPEVDLPLIWNMMGSSGNPVGIGNYDVIGGLFDPAGYYDYTKVSVPIKIIPEPATIVLLGFGFTQILRRKRYNPLSADKSQ